MRVLLVRHGETVENVEDILQGHTRGVLSDRGKLQVQRLAERLSSERLHSIISSDLVRARYTTERIAEFHKVPVSFHVDLRERNLAQYEGCPRSELDAFFASTPGNRFELAPPGAESVVQVRLRAERAWNELVLSQPRYSTVVVSSHGLFNRVLLTWLLQLPVEKTYELEQDNTCINELQIAHNGAVDVVKINCVAHLAADEFQPRGKTLY